MSNNTGAIAPWLGYKTQEYRLVQRLLKAPKGHSLGFELLDDVHQSSEDSLILEQDKISISGRNPLSNQSKELWKTISNWIKVIDSDNLDISKTKFVIFTNRKFTSKVLELLINSSNTEEAKVAYNKVIEFVKKPSDGIKEYCLSFLDMDERKYQFIVNMEYEYGNSSPATELKKAYININTSLTDEAEYVIEALLGWTSNVLSEQATKKKVTIITANAFGRRRNEIESQCRQQTILHYMCERASDDDDVLGELNQSPTYIKQLGLVEVGDIEIQEAVLAKMESKDAVSEWTIEGSIQDSNYSQYSNTLKRKWNIKKNIVYTQNSSLSEVGKGCLLYYECLDAASSVKLGNKSVDDFFSTGTFQILSDSLDLGWHPDYLNLLKRNV
jgi:hypothetical protein